MQLLALESSTHLLSVAIWRDGTVFERSQEIANAGSQYLLPWVSDLLAEAGTTLRQLDAIAFGSGPGGFVGVRLSCAIAQGLGTGLDLPVIGVGTLEAIAFNSGGSNVYTCMDARMGQVYAAAWRIAEQSNELVLTPGVYEPAEVPLPPTASWVGAGDGFAAHRDSLQRRLGGLIGEVLPGVAPSAAAVARIAADRLERGESADAGSASPLYVRDTVALTTAERLARGGRR